MTYNKPRIGCNTTETFESAAFSDGRILYDGSGSPDIYTYQYYITDHLGSTRMVVDDQGTPVEAVNYMPYGSMQPVDIALNPDIAVREKFTGKEFDREGAGYGVTEIAIALDFPVPASNEATPNRMEVYYSNAPDDVSKADVVPVQIYGSNGYGRFTASLPNMESRTISKVRFFFENDTRSCTVADINEVASVDAKVTISRTFAVISEFTGVKQKSFLTYQRTAGENGFYLAGLRQYYFGARYYDPEIGGWLSCDKAGQFWSGYGYGANPVIMVDEDGNFITWSIGKNGISIGFNLAPIGIGWGAGINVGWGDGFSLGAYTEMGYRIGGTGAGLNGGTFSQSFDYNFKHQDLSTTSTVSVGAQFLIFNAGGSVSDRNSFTTGSESFSWSLGVGMGAGDGKGNTFGLNLGYGGDFRGHNEWSYGMSGSLDREGHFKRNQINGSWEIDDLFEKNGDLKKYWKEIEPQKAIFHMYGKDKLEVKKYVHQKAGYEVVITISRNGSPIILTQKNDPRSMGTYNYYIEGTIMNSIGHFCADIYPWWFYGNASNDPSNFIQRVTGME